MSKGFLLRECEKSNEHNKTKKENGIRRITPRWLIANAQHQDVSSMKYVECRQEPSNCVRYTLAHMRL